MVSWGPARGYTLLAILLILAVVTALVSALQTQAGQERRRAAQEKNGILAAAIAEAGLERTEGYLAQLLVQQPDFDRALDPNLDDYCFAPDMTASNDAGWDDNLPLFEGQAIAWGPGDKHFLLVPHGGGAYLVRIDDDADELLPGMDPAATNDHIGGMQGCSEGPTLAGVQNLLRDRNRTVVVTAVGIYPGTDPSAPLATKTLRATVAPPSNVPGIISGGDIELGYGGERVLGPYSSVSAQGDAVLPPTLFPGATIAATGDCSPTLNCIPASEAFPSPVVDPWDPTNAPYACTLPGPCTPFYYARYDGSLSTVWRWNYWAPHCNNPRAWDRLCYPAGAITDTIEMQVPYGTFRCNQCWQWLGSWSKPAQPPSAPAEIRMDDVGADNAGASYNPVGSTNQVWTLTRVPQPAGGGGCSDDPDVYPGDLTLFTASTLTGVGFHPGSGTLPHGVWMLEGNLLVDGALGSCATQASLITLGHVDMVGSGANLSLAPAAPKGYILLSGRDLRFSAPNQTLTACAPGGAVLVHEQLSMSSGDLLSAQVAVEDQSCDSDVMSPYAISGMGATIQVLFPPTYASGPLAWGRRWEESAL